MYKLFNVVSIISRWRLKLFSFFHFHHLFTLMSSKEMCVLSTQWMSMGLSVVLVWTSPTDFHSDKNTWNNCSNILFCVLQKRKSYTGLEQHNNDLLSCSFKMHTWQRNRFLELSPSEKAIWIWFLTVCHMVHKYGDGISNTSFRSCP